MAMASSDSSSGGNGDRDVFGSLPNTRPQRRSARRDRARREGEAGRVGAGEGAAPSRAQAAKAKPAAQASRAASAPKAKPAARAKPAAAAAPPRAGAAQIPPAGLRHAARDDDGVPHGAQLVTTAVQAAGELAQIGLAAGGRALKSALERLPRP